jgi:hypothetical protein
MDERKRRAEKRERKKWREGGEEERGRRHPAGVANGGGKREAES